MSATGYFGPYMLGQALAAEPGASVGIPYAFLLQVARAAMDAGVWAPPAGVPVEDALDSFAAGMRFRPEGETVLCDGSDVEERTVYADGSYSTRLG
ncbi:MULTISPECIES: hypothetical protein [unclassified Methylobacterium]|uniref:hypothetical protein n=1 Tax=unclassified Methylobacterium TaxID=2615210 RepID=UPI0008E01949|nr:MULTISPECIES: hypothetical protein [unclassified Methylobacterium]SFU50260.1 hypothetical protein SAMN02799643_00945 [Methylobacterium sp. UNCCL125]